MSGQTPPLHVRRNAIPPCTSTALHESQRVPGGKQAHAVAPRHDTGNGRHSYVLGSRGTSVFRIWQ